MPEKNTQVHLQLADLKLLMDNYQNILKMNTILLEQQKQVMSLQNQTLSKQDAANVNLIKSDATLNNISSKLDGCSTDLEKASNAVKNVENRLKEVSSNVKDSFNDLEIQNTKSHSAIVGRLYISMGGMITIIISLIGLLAMAYDKFSILSKILELVK